MLIASSLQPAARYCPGACSLARYHEPALGSDLCPPALTIVDAQRRFTLIQVREFWNPAGCSPGGRLVLWWRVCVKVHHRNFGTRAGDGHRSLVSPRQLARNGRSASTPAGRTRRGSGITGWAARIIIPSTVRSVTSSSPFSLVRRT